eukprot:TRINITY_DN4402_c0_g1_i1.p1 TRINITY_DN4402_c0_g1~~TRINITY_DN4402_c0_g1_i1.p1  ORF type:complete len:267 (+),score=37.38 TRINITY_DN4402_c0_g1_i1:1657-2457(+)
MLFVIVAEALNGLMERANHMKLVYGFSIDNEAHKVTQLYFAGDTIIFCDASLAQVNNLKIILKWFEVLSGLKINYEKCEFIGVQMDLSQVDYLANIFGCKDGKLPKKYLGLPLYLGIPKKSLWDSMVERVEKKLSSWKGKYLSMGARITLIKSVLSSIPIYFLSCFKCPMSVLRRIEKIQRDFLWNDSIERMKYHLVKWETVRNPLVQGGLGIRSIEKVNKALLVNWLWRMGGPGKSLWKRILSCKYRLDNDGWCVASQIYNVSGI